ncbi:conserved Plasmodium protein, unknown function [Plasmodium yoelii]|uniref:CCAAT-box DNA binding protein subunit B n=3 Tax=Plasmodium yoelii TaxID=5861 RepID=A0AAF0B3N2_PLAYO|nr:conserved Plasmodium protein, unknown function [Plasmodium yoelii]WBY56234.1 hypothetical protein Py17XNL_000704115 [Plasmodium yoelii yoelii]CDU17140.1 conserved Plasmodium protein, unknown function [Plasmodium yoelii]VTZ76219.1 conserved Plasmodium protein, unknown function [Plasmodium yoelii]|eukprot:XP_726856.2 conserved Plasmodium protein, unknown function [Plasmodium yoelii]
MELYEDEVYEKANINVTIIVNDEIKDIIIKNLNNNMNNDNININSYNYNNINKINNFLNNSEQSGKSDNILTTWLKKIKNTSSAIIFCVDWQNIINEKNDNNNNDVEVNKRENIDYKNGVECEEDPNNDKQYLNVHGLSDEPVNTYNPFENSSNEYYNSYSGDNTINNRTEDKEEKSKSDINFIHNEKYMKEISNGLIKKIEEINTIIMKRKKLCKIILLVVLPENTKSTEEYIKYISFLNSQNISAIFITLGLKEIHNKIMKLQNLLKDCINSFFKQYIISYESKSGKNVLHFFTYNFKKAYILEMLEKYDESMKIYVNICKVFYEHIGEQIFPNKKSFFEYVIFFNCVSLRMISIYLYFKDIKKALHHIYTHNKIIFLALMNRDEFISSEHNKKLVEIINIFNIKGDKNFIDCIRYNEYDDGRKDKKILYKKNNSECVNEFVDILYDIIIKEYVYYNLLSCIYFYFYRIIKNFNLNMHDVIIYAIYTCYCIYYKIKAIEKQKKLLKEFPGIKFDKYITLSSVMSLYDFILNILIEIFRIISTNKITNLTRIIIYLLSVIYYEKGKYVFALYLLLQFFKDETGGVIFNYIDVNILKNMECEFDKFCLDLQDFAETRIFLKIGNRNSNEPMLFLMIICLGILINHKKVGININEKEMRNENFNINKYEKLFIEICFEYINCLIKNKKEKEKKDFNKFIKKYFKFINKENMYTPININISICDVFFKLYYLVENNIKTFLKIKNKNNLNFIYLPFIGILMNKEMCFYKIKYSNFYDGHVYSSCEFIKNNNEEKFLSDFINNEIVLVNNNEGIITESGNPNKIRNVFFLNEKNIMNMCIENVNTNMINIEYIQLYLYIYNNIIKIKINNIYSYMLKRKYMEKVYTNNFNSFENEKNNSNEFNVFSKEQQQNESLSEYEEIKKDCSNDDVTIKAKNKIVDSNSKDKNKRKMFEIKENENDKSEFYKLKDGIYLNKYENKIIVNKNKYFFSNLVNKYVNYFIYSNNNILYMNEFNIGYIYISYSKYITEFELNFKYEIENSKNTYFYLLAKRDNVLDIEHICDGKEISFFGNKDMFKFVEDEETNCECNNTNDCVDNFVINNKIYDLFRKKEEYIHEETVDKKKRDFFLFEIKGNKFDNISLHTKIKSLYGKSNFCNEPSMLYKIKTEKNKSEKNKSEKNKKKKLMFDINYKEKLICIPFLLYTNEKNNVNIKIEFSFKNNYFSDNIKYPIQYSVIPSIISMVTNVNMIDDKNISHNTLGNLENNSTERDVINGMVIPVNNTNKDSIKEEINCNDDNNNEVKNLDNSQGMEYFYYYIYIYNNKNQSIIIKSLTNGKLEDVVKLGEKSTYSNLVKINNKEKVNLEYQFNYNNLYFPFNKIFENAIFINYLKMPHEDIGYNIKELNNINNDKKSKIKIELNYSKIVKYNECFTVESIITNEANITEEVIIFLYDKRKKKKKKIEQIEQKKKANSFNNIYFDQFNITYNKKNQDLSYKQNSYTSYKTDSDDNSLYSSEDLENINFDENNSDSNIIYNNLEKKRNKKYIVNGVKMMKSILLPYQTFRLKWSFVAFTYGFLKLPNILIQRKNKIKNNINVFSSENIELFVI